MVRKFKSSYRGVPSNVKFTKYKIVVVEGGEQVLRLLRKQGFSASKIGKNRIRVKLPIEGKYRKPVGKGFKWYKWHADIDNIIHAEQTIKNIAHAWRGDLHKGPFKNL